MSEEPTASIVIPTRSRPAYLDVALGSVVPQAVSARAEVLVVCGERDPATATVARRHGVRLVEVASGGANAARNAGVEASRAELIVFIDDDIQAPPGWLDELLRGTAAAPDCDVFGGPIRARLEGGGPHACGREAAPITTLDFGPHDRDVPLVWSANMAIRRRALAKVGKFDERIDGRGEEEDWELRYRQRGGRVRYIAAAGLDHRRLPSDATVRQLSLSAYRLGRSARRYDVRKGMQPPIRSELRVLAGCAWHTVRRRCLYGIVMGAGSAGRVREALAARRS